MFKQLLWKEWRENLWKLGFCLATSLAFIVLLFRVRLFPDLANGLVISFVMTFMVPVIYALDLFAGEMSNRTIHLLFKIPVPRWQIFASKMVTAILGTSLIFLLTGLAMEMMGHGRETMVGFLLSIHLRFGLCTLLILAWFAVFGCQNRSEAVSLVVLASILIGWGIVLLWSTLCEVHWASHLVPYTFITWTFEQVSGKPTAWFSPIKLLCLQILALGFTLSLAGYRYVKIRRYL